MKLYNDIKQQQGHTVNYELSTVLSIKSFLPEINKCLSCLMKDVEGKLWLPKANGERN